jgi:hypothetical protein
MSANVEWPIYTVESRPSALGAAQEVSSPTFAKERSVSVPFSEGTLKRPAAQGRLFALRTDQFWEGTITEVRPKDFVALLVDQTNPNNPDEQVVFDAAEVSESDRAYIQPGAAFYWIIGSERSPAGQIRNVSIVEFRRVPTWTRSAIARAADRAARIKDAFHSGGFEK